MIAAFQAWWRRNVVALDPDPRYAYLDQLDGRKDGPMRFVEHKFEGSVFFRAPPQSSHDKER